MAILAISNAPLIISRQVLLITFRFAFLFHRISAVSVRKAISMPTPNTTYTPSMLVRSIRFLDSTGHQKKKEILCYRGKVKHQYFYLTALSNKEWTTQVDGWHKISNQNLGTMNCGQSQGNVDSFYPIIYTSPKRHACNWLYAKKGSMSINISQFKARDIHLICLVEQKKCFYFLWCQK